MLTSYHYEDRTISLCTTSAEAAIMHSWVVVSTGACASLGIVSTYDEVSSDITNFAHNDHSLRSPYLFVLSMTALEAPRIRIQNFFYILKDSAPPKLPTRYCSYMFCIQVRTYVFTEWYFTDESVSTEINTSTSPIYATQ